MRSDEAFERAYQRVALQHMLVMLAEFGIPPERLARYCLDIAEMMRSAPASDEVRRHADLVARQYEDMANMMLGGGLLAR